MTARRQVQLTSNAAGVVVASPAYRLELPIDRPWAVLADADGSEWARLALLASVDTTEGLDETIRLDPPEVVARWPDRVVLRIVADSGRWGTRQLRIDCRARDLRISAVVEGAGWLTDCHLLGGWSSAEPGLGTGFARSGRTFSRLLNPSPSDPGRIEQSAGEPAIVGVLGGGQPGRGRWFFTPAPFCLPVARPDRDAWIGLGLAVPVDRATFTEWHYEPTDDGWSLRLAYEGQTRVDGRWESPAVTIRFGARDPYEAIAAHSEMLRAEGLAPTAPPLQPAWWNEPMFCGWGAQSHLARERGGRPSDHATQACYDEFLGVLDRERIAPGTIVIDDRWQSTYGRNEVDLERWPDMAGWIARRHDNGQRVLLWWKAWDPEGLDSSMCVRTADGRTVTADPGSAAYGALVRERLDALLSPGGLDADGLKIDFTALGPSGPGLRHEGAGWGVALLHDLLALLHDAAKQAKADALVITHAPNPAFADVSDMLRLNDLLRLADPGAATVRAVPQYAHRARVVRAACPATLIDTDDWCLPNRREWRAWLAAKPEFGVPALYYATHIDFSGEPLRPADYAAIRRAWAAHRAGR